MSESVAASCAAPAESSVLASLLGEVATRRGGTLVPPRGARSRCLLTLHTRVSRLTLGAARRKVCATLSLRAAVSGRKLWYVVVASCNLLAFFFLTQVLPEGLGIGVAYRIWAAAGVALTAVASAVLFTEPLNRMMAGGIGLIVIGVLLVEVGGGHA